MHMRRQHQHMLPCKNKTKQSMLRNNTSGLHVPYTSMFPCNHQKQHIYNLLLAKQENVRLIAYAQNALEH